LGANPHTFLQSTHLYLWDEYHVRNFWVDYIEIPGTSYSDAAVRYTYQMPEQENLWKYYQVLIQRLRLYVDKPFTPGPSMV
jgi:ATP-dependent DNA helicase RecG